MWKNTVIVSKKEKYIMLKPSVSIIVPVYSIEKYVSTCVKSIMTQTFSDYEVLLIDDGSTDNSGEICDRYASEDSRIQVIHKPNGGLTSARNAGLCAAKGEWIMHVDGDDWIEPTMVEQMLQKATHTGAEIVIGDLNFAFPDKKTVWHAVEWTENKTVSLNRYIQSGWNCLCGSMAKKSIYRKHKLFSPAEITYCEDFHLMVRLCYFASRVVHLAKPLYNYRQRGDSIMHNLNKRMEHDEQWVYQDIISFFKERACWDAYERTMCWRVLKSTQELVLDRREWRKFKEVTPEKSCYIWNCPYINRKLKLNMWCLTHHISWLSWSMLILRTLRHG